jgi:hypothetical protein
LSTRTPRGRSSKPPDAGARVVSRLPWNFRGGAVNGPRLMGVRQGLPPTHLAHREPAGARLRPEQHGPGPRASDEPEILCLATTPICPMSADAVRSVQSRGSTHRSIRHPLASRHPARQDLRQRGYRCRGNQRRGRPALGEMRKPRARRPCRQARGSPPSGSGFVESSRAHRDRRPSIHAIAPFFGAMKPMGSPSRSSPAPRCPGRSGPGASAIHEDADLDRIIPRRGNTQPIRMRDPLICCTRPNSTWFGTRSTLGQVRSKPPRMPSSRYPGQARMLTLRVCASARRRPSWPRPGEGGV